MIFPSADDYLHIVEQRTPGNLPSLRDYQFLYEGEHLFSIQGNYAIIFKAIKENKAIAIRCFTDSEEEVFERYRQAADYCKNKQLPWKVNFELLEKQVRYNEHYYPVLKMDWAEGRSLKEYLDAIVHDGNSLTLLQQELVQLSQSLEKNSIGHGNLNLEHIYVEEKNGKPVLRLLDYDSLFIPAFYKKNCLSAGTPGFQHPMRLASDFSETIDRFSFWVLITALEAIKADASLWTDPGRSGYDKNENLLFTYRDLCAPETSIAFQLAGSLPNKTLHHYLEKLRSFCQLRSLDSIEAPELYLPNKSAGLREPASKEQNIRAEKKPAVEELAVKNSRSETETETPVADEIILFEADRSSIQEGEAVSLRWKVKGESRLHISGLGYVHEKSGTRKLVLKYPSDFILTIGNRSKQIRVEVTPKTKDLFTSKDLVTTNKKTNQGWKVISLVAACALVFVGVYFLSAGKDEEKGPATAAIVAPMQTSQVKPEAETFSSEKISGFLSQLYQSYNGRNRASILNHYAPKMIEYYDAVNLNKDSLSPIIGDLFIKPAFYKCEADMSTVKFSKQEKNCLVSVTVHETIQANKKSKREIFTSTIEYILDPSYTIISERHTD